MQCQQSSCNLRPDWIIKWFSVFSVLLLLARAGRSNLIRNFTSTFTAMTSWAMGLYYDRKFQFFPVYNGVRLVLHLLSKLKVESWNTECFRAQIPARRSPAARWAGVWTADCWRTEPWRWRIAIRWGSVRLLKWIPLDFPEASSVSAYLPFWGNLYAQNRLFHAILEATIYLPFLAAMQFDYSYSTDDW